MQHIRKVTLTELLSMRMDGKTAMANEGYDIKMRTAG